MNFIWESVIEFTDDIIEPFSEDVWGIRLQVHNNALAYHSKKLEEDSDLVSYLPTARRLRLIKLRMTKLETLKQLKEAIMAEDEELFRKIVAFYNVMIILE